MCGCYVCVRWSGFVVFRLFFHPLLLAEPVRMQDETIGKHLVQNFIQPEDRSSVDSVLQKALTGIETSNFDLPLISKIGKRSSVLLNATTRRDANGAIIGVVGVGQDITKLNQVMAEAKRVADDLTRFGL